jgi:ABC-type transport system involved in multi-copper enzyme maturation permease subunit
MASTFRTIAKYERKILMRSWFFRIFTAFSLFVLFIFNMGAISEVGDMEWAYRAVPSNMPYFNLFLLNIAQAIIAVFLSSEFIKRERKQDTTEVFYVRSISNAAYLFGKAWSILSIFLLVNGAALLLGLIFILPLIDLFAHLTLHHRSVHSFNEHHTQPGSDLCHFAGLYLIQPNFPEKQLPLPL